MGSLRRQKKAAAPADQTPARAPRPAQAAAGQLPESKRLAVKMPTNQPSNWCWAATASAVACYYAGLGMGTARSPAEIAAEWLRENCDPPPQEKDDPRNRRLAIVGPLGEYYREADDRYHPLPFDAVVGEIHRGHPICCRVSWSDNDPAHSDGHYMMVVGYHQTNCTVDVADCQFGDATVAYDTFCTAYRPDPQHMALVGSWDETYLTQPPP